MLQILWNAQRYLKASTYNYSINKSVSSQKLDITKVKEKWRKEGSKKKGRKKEGNKVEI